MAASKIQAVRRDPRRRAPDGARHGTKLVGADPNKHYVLVSLNGGDQEHTVEEYESCGYQIVRNREGGVKLLVGKTVEREAPIMYRGHVLMCLDKAERVRIEREGIDGNAGQDLVDELEDRIVDKQGGMDPLRGMRARYLGVENDTKRPDVEMDV